MKIYEGIIDGVMLLDKPIAPAHGLYLKLHDSNVNITIGLDLLPHDRAWYEARKNQRIKVTCSWTPGEIPLVDVASI